jgi:hypothetical protein
MALVVARFVVVLSDGNNEVERVTAGVIVEREDGGDVARQDVVETVTLHVEGEFEHAGRLRRDRQALVDQATAVRVERTAATLCIEREVSDGWEVSHPSAAGLSDSSLLAEKAETAPTSPSATAAVPTTFEVR